MGGSEGFSHTPKEVKKIDTKYRSIKTKLPVPESIPLLENMYSRESQAMHGQYPMIWDMARDFQVFDQWGNTWLDFTSAIFLSNAGHGNKKIVNRLKNLLNKPLLHTYTYASNERIQYLDYLIKNTSKQFEKAFLLSAGTEATEVALKLMRLYGQKEDKRRGGVICLNSSYHGRTMGAQLMTGDDKAKEWIGFQDPNMFHIDFPYPWDVENPEEFFNHSIEGLLSRHKIDPDRDLCGFMLETFQGWGAIFYPKEYVQALTRFAKKHNILVSFDEMQSGFGRTGELFGYQQYEVEPDILACGKGASSGLPLSIVMGAKEIMDLPDKGSMSSTHSANPLVCAAGYENLKSLIDDGLIENSKELGIVLHRKLGEIKDMYPDHLKYVFGKGLLAGLIFIDNDGTKLTDLCNRVAEKAFQKGLLVVHTGRESIKLAPPMTINEEALLDGIEVLEESIRESI
mgnify:CR=1 FL=1|tara:strand:- start:10877 stop:12244 length:1368 start_codon:yes stop_codon:yes gene_type:complete